MASFTRAPHHALLATLIAGCSSPLPGQLAPDPTSSGPRASGPGLARTADLAEPRASHTATLLADGTVLIAGGFRKGPDGRSQLYSNTAENYDLTTRTFRAAGSLVGARCGHTATTLPDGKILLAGALPGGGALIVGGYDDDVRTSTRAWLLAG